MHFLGVNWDNDKKSPLFKYRNSLDEGKITYLPLTISNVFTISIQQQRICIGDCDNNFNKRSICRNAVKNSPQCRSCYAKDSTYFMHLNGLHYDQIKKLKLRPSINYLNIFGDELIKTGVTARSRRFTRVLEQGAIASIFFTDTDGYTARLIENSVSKVLKIKQSVSWDRKIQYLQNNLTSDMAHKKLFAIHNQIIENLDKRHLSAFSKPEYYFNKSHYCLNFSKDTNNISLYEEFSFDDVISGEIVGVYGEIVFLKQKNSSIIAINTKSLQGFIFKISRKEYATNIKKSPKQIKFQKQVLEKLSLFKV